MTNKWQGPLEQTDFNLPDSVSGSPTQDFDEWLQIFNRYATFSGWTPDQTLNAFMMFLGGSALRVCQRQTPEVRGDLNALQEALREVFVSPHQQFLRRQELNNHTQGPLEPLESYLDDIDTRASRLQLTVKIFTKLCSVSFRAYDKI